MSCPIVDLAWISNQVFHISAAYHASGLFSLSDFPSSGLLASPRTIEHFVTICQNFLEGCYPMQVHHEVVCEFGDGQLKIRLAVVPAEVRVARSGGELSGTTAGGEGDDDGEEETEGEEGEGERQGEREEEEGIFEMEEV